MTDRATASESFLGRLDGVSFFGVPYGVTSSEIVGTVGMLETVGTVGTGPKMSCSAGRIDLRCDRLGSVIAGVMVSP